jgi:hypothetical protein
MHLARLARFTRLARLAQLSIVAGLLAAPGVALAEGPGAALDECARAFSDAPDLTKAGHLLRARAALIRCASESCPAKMRPLCAGDLRTLEPQIPTVVFAAKTSDGQDVLDARVVEDGRPIAERLEGTAVAVDPGPHRFRFERPDGTRAETEVLLREGEKARSVGAVFAVLPPAEQPATPPSTTRPVPWTVWATGGAALAATGSFAFFGLRGLDQRSALRSCKGSCSSEQLQPVRDSFTAANVSLAVAVLAAGAAVTFFVTRPTVTAGITGTSAFVEARF